MKQLLPCFCSLLLFTGNSSGQFLRFSQYMAAPMTLNPAMTGLGTEDYRITSNHRSQWSSISPMPYQTSTMSVDINTLKNKLPKGDALGVGVIGLFDRSGSGGVLNKTGGLSLAYHKTLGKDSNNHISIGAQGMWVHKNIDYARLTYEDIHNNGNGTLAYPFSVFTEKETMSYFTYNVGAMYSGKLGKQSSLYLGYSLYYVNRPIEYYLQSISQVIYTKHSIYGGTTHHISNNVVLNTSGLFLYHGAAMELAAGSTVGVVLNPRRTIAHNKTILYMGGWYRYQDALVPYVGFERRKVRWGFSYDINISDFTPAARSVGAYEVSLSFNGQLSRKARNADNSVYAPVLY
ncbi:MAG: PorP/SprF family type IX secretion system membrane protein [Taibaiella sp.]|nr:PorP/SprF family type IX secretion system membrane protein [Taibaiella sp.]